MNFHQKPVTYVGNVQLKVSDINASKDFYTDILGLKIKEQSSEKVSFTTNGKDTLLTIVKLKGMKTKTAQTAGLYHFALLLPTRADLSQVVKHFIRKNVRFGAGDHLVSEALYLNDPDGNGIEIYADRPDRNWQWDNGEVTMTTNPVDFDDLLKEPAADSWTGLPKGTVMGHIHLQVNDLGNNKSFYVDGLGFSVVNRYGGEALFLSDSGYHHHIALNTWGGSHIRLADALETGIESYSIIFPNQEKRDEKIKTLKVTGVSVLEGSGQYYTFDPSHIKVYLQVK